MDKDKIECTCMKWQCMYDPYCKLHGSLSAVRPDQLEEKIEEKFYTK